MAAVRRAQSHMDALWARFNAAHRRRQLMARLFEQDGELTADAHEFFGMLADAAELGAIGMAESDRKETWRAGRQSLVRESMKWLDRDEMDLIKKRLDAAKKESEL